MPVTRHQTPHHRHPHQQTPVNFSKVKRRPPFGPERRSKAKPAPPSRVNAPRSN